MSKSQHSVKLIAYDAIDLNRLTYTNGDLVYDNTNKTVRVMDGITTGGISVATEAWVNQNALTVVTLSSALNNYVPLSTLTSYSTTSQMNSAIATAVAGVSFTYNLPTAGTGSGGTLGGVKVDGTTITINPTTGVISGANTYVLPKAQAATSGNTLGGVIPDGTTITINPTTGVISGANTYVLPTATSSVKGGVIIPAATTSGIINSSGTISIATATTGQIGGVIPDGSTITISGSGVISAPYTYTLPAANTTSLGGVIIPTVTVSGLYNTGGTIRLATAATNQLGGVKVDGTSITISNGVISASLAGGISFQGGWNANSNTPLLSNGTGVTGYEYVVTQAGSQNFGGTIPITFGVGDLVIYANGTWGRVPLSSSSGVTNNSLTFDTSGAGGIAGTTFNGSSAVTLSYNSIGASPTAGNTSLVTVGTITTGIWNGTLISSAYGGTGVNNGTYTITLAGSYTYNQDVSSGSSPTFSVTNMTGTSQYITVGNIRAGAANQLLYQTAANTTGFVTAPSDNTHLTYTTANGFAWTTSTNGTVTSVGGTGTVNGLTLTGSVTSSGNLTLGGTLSLVSPPAIGLTTPNTGAFTTLSASSTVSGAGFSTYLASPPAIGGTAAAQVNATNLVITSGEIYGQQPTPTALTSTATLTIAQLLTNIITVTSTTAVNLTLPTGTLTDAGILSGTLPSNGFFDWNIINLGTSTGAATIVAGTNHTYVGSTTVNIGTSAGFRTRKLASNSYTTYRIY
jgi:hypothetical protein